MHFHSPRTRNSIDPEVSHEVFESGRSPEAHHEVLAHHGQLRSVVGVGVFACPVSLVEHPLEVVEEGG